MDISGGTLIKIRGICIFVKFVFKALVNPES